MTEIDLPDEALAPRPTLTQALTVARPLADQFRAALDQLDTLDVGMATAEERAELVAFRQMLQAVSVSVRTRLSTIDHLFKRAYAVTGARTFLAGTRKQDVVKVEPGRGRWIVREAELHKQLQALAKAGVIPQDDADRAVSAEITYHVDNRVLKGLEKYGPKVKAVLDATRHYEEAPAESATVSYPKP